MDKPKTSLRKEPKQRRSQILVDAVAEAATRVLPRVGVSGATTNRIAEVAGVSIGSLYQYFPTKESILARAIERHLDKKELEYRDMIDSQSQAALAEVVEALTAQATQIYFDDAPMLRVLFAEAPALDRLDAIVAHRENVTAMLVEILLDRGATKTREYLHDEVLFVVDAVMGAVQAALMRDELPSREVFSERLRDLVLGVVSTRKLM